MGRFARKLRRKCSNAGRKPARLNAKSRQLFVVLGKLCALLGFVCAGPEQLWSQLFVVLGKLCALPGLVCADLAQFWSQLFVVLGKLCALLGLVCAGLAQFWRQLGRMFPTAIWWMRSRSAARKSNCGRSRRSTQRICSKILFSISPS